MFGIFSKRPGPTRAKLVEIKGQNLVFATEDKELAEKKNTQIQLLLPEAGDPVIRVYPAALRILPDGQRLWSSHILEEKKTILNLEALAARHSPLGLGPRTRQSPRIPMGLRCRSRELPDYQGLSADVSRHGIQLQVRGAVPVAEYLALSLSLDVAWLPELSIQVQVRWCRNANQRDEFLVGAELTAQHPEVEALWDRYCTDLQERRATSLQRSDSLSPSSSAPVSLASDYRGAIGAGALAVPPV